MYSVDTKCRFLYTHFAKKKVLISGKDRLVFITDRNSSSGMAPSSFFFEQVAEVDMLQSMTIMELVEIFRKIHWEKKILL